MITRIHGNIVFECDCCGEFLETDESDFHDARVVADDAGWRARKIGLEWNHYCAECKAAETAK